MLKFFRKNEKFSRWFLIIGMTLLMVSWLVFDQSSSFFTDMLVGRTTWATTTDGKSITESERVYLQQQTRAIAALGDQTVRALGLDKDPVHWFLLTLEAEQAGLVGGESDGRSRLQKVAAANKVPEMNLIGALCRESGLSPAQLFSTMAQLNGIDRYINVITSGPGQLSTTRLEQTAASLLAAVTGEIVVLNGVQSKVDVPAPTEEALAAQLATYGTDAPGAGKFGFGYLVEDRVRMEWLSIPATAINALVEQSTALSNLELRKYWMEHQSEFPAAALSSTPPSFETMRDAVRAKVLATALTAKRQEIGKFLSDRMQLSLRGIAQVNGYYTLPPDWRAKQLGLATLGQEVAAKFSIPAPAIQDSGAEWTLLTAIDGMQGLGTAQTTRFGSQPMRTSQLVQAVRELGGKSTIVMQTGVASPVLESPAGELIVVRVTEAEESAPPSTVESVRTTLVADVNRVARFEKLTALVPQIEQAAADQGLASVAATYGVPVQPFTDLRQSDKNFLQYGLKLPSQIPDLGADATVARAIAERAMKLPSTRPAAELPLIDRTLVVASPDKLAIAVVRIDSVTPTNQGDIAALKQNPRFRSIAANDQSAGTPVDMFTLAALKARHGFAYANPRNATSDDELDAGSTDGGAAADAPARVGG
ncbi:MAG: hypothetical protein EXS03_05820 [Phycisphaerales bacterium]|nr:hypothetical protein [Phycisphaerales bacterium]